MSPLMLGELCAGYGGLGKAVENVLGAELSWYSEFDAAPSRIMAHHWPDAPNLGDMTQIDWAAAPKVDVLSGGTPCQDLSHAGRRRGMTDGTRSNLWVQMREAIATIQPTWVVWENVRGAYSAKADSEMEQCPGCMGDVTGKGKHPLRAFGRVLGDLSELGFDAEWRGIKASDVGAPHNRFRVFVLARRRDADHAPGAGLEGVRAGGLQIPRLAGGPWGPGGGSNAIAQDAHHPTGGERRLPASGQTESGGPRANPGGRSGTPVANGDGSGPSRFGQQRGENPEDAPGLWGGPDYPVQRVNWGRYEPAIRRWEAVLGRPAPAPTELNNQGSYRLSPAFCEWLMGQPAGWITDPAIGINRKEMLRACGNGVVTQQAEAALADMLAVFEMEVAA